jgi:hypothetical protein
MLIEATLLGLAVLTWKKLGKKEEWTPAREEMYQSALEHLKGPAGVAKLREIADSCEKNGFHAKAFALRERAKLRATDANVKKARHEAYLKGMRSTNVPGILALAASFEKISATGAAKNLRKHAENVQNGIDDTFAVDTPEVPAPPPAPSGAMNNQADTPMARASTPVATRTGEVREKAPTLPDEVPQEEPAKAEAKIPPPAPQRKARVKPEGFDDIEAAKAAVNGKGHAEVIPTQEDQASAEGP